MKALKEKKKIKVLCSRFQCKMMANAFLILEPLSKVNSRFHFFPLGDLLLSANLKIFTAPTSLHPYESVPLNSITVSTTVLSTKTFRPRSTYTSNAVIRQKIRNARSSWKKKVGELPMFWVRLSQKYQIYVVLSCKIP